MDLSNEDMRRAAMACRAAAFQAEQDAGRQSNPSVRATFEREAAEYQKLAARFDPSTSQSAPTEKPPAR
jgi:hypothetical protein